MRFTVPIVLMVFNRPEPTRRLFEVIKTLRPLRLMVIQDAPRESHPKDKALCEEVHRIVTAIDWPCQADGIFAETNMGCAERVRSGIDQVFAKEERAIILEDDCIPDPTFFRYCEELLDRYVDDERVMAISGDNFHFGQMNHPHSYYFSRYFHCWGWATWRRAWQLHDHTMPYWPELKRDGWLESFLKSDTEIKAWRSHFDSVMNKSFDTWDFNFVYTIWRHNGLVILPKENLISNVGFGDDATHTFGAHPYANMATVPMTFPMVHPPHMVRDFIADERFSINTFTPRRPASSW